MLETKSFGNNFKMLVTVWPFGHQHSLSFYISVGHKHLKDVTNIKIQALSLSNQYHCHHTHVSNLLRPLCLKKRQSKPKVEEANNGCSLIFTKKITILFREISKTHGVEQKKCEILFLSFKFSLIFCSLIPK